MVYILGYASHIREHCTQQDRNKLENFQLEIVRIATGARRFTSHEHLYKETNWMSLQEWQALIKL